MFRLRVALALCLFSIAVAACSSGTDTAAPAATTLGTPTPKPVPPSLEKPTYTVAKGSISDELKLAGRVSATLDEDVFFTQDGFLKTLYVKRDDPVTKGQLLAEIDLGTLPNELKQAEIALSSAEASLGRSTAGREFAIQKANLDLADARGALAELQKPPKAADLDAARVAIKRSEIALQDVRNSASAAKTQAQLNVDQAANAVRDRQIEYARVVELTHGTPKTADERINLEKAKRALDDAQIDLDKAKLAYDLARQNEISAVSDAEQQIKEAQIALTKLSAGPDKLAVAAAQRQITRAQVAIAEAEAQSVDPEEQKRVDQTRLDVENMKARIESGRLYAPFDGRVSEISAKPGDSVAAYKPVVNVINPTKLELVVDGTLSADLAKIGIGQQVNITFSRYPTQILSGTVERLPTTLTSTSSSVKADPAIHISFPTAGLQLDVGDVSQVIVTLEHKEGVLWLPPQAVRSFDGRRFVVVQEGVRQRRVDVKVGIVTLDRVEITEGVKEGDIVIGQ